MIFNFRCLSSWLCLGLSLCGLLFLWPTTEKESCLEAAESSARLLLCRSRLLCLGSLCWLSLRSNFLDQRPFGLSSCRLWLIIGRKNTSDTLICLCLLSCCTCWLFRYKSDFLAIIVVGRSTTLHISLLCLVSHDLFGHVLKGRRHIIVWAWHYSDVCFVIYGI